MHADAHRTWWSGKWLARAGPTHRLCLVLRPTAWMIGNFFLLRNVQGLVPHQIWDVEISGMLKKWSFQVKDKKLID